jgi:hypothetical protein
VVRRGKSSLLDIMAMRRVEGQVLVNGQARASATFLGMAKYVTQVGGGTDLVCDRCSL